MRRYLVWLSMIGAFAFVIVLGTISQRLYDAAAADQKTLRAFCRSTRNSMRSAATALRSADSAFQKSMVRAIAEDRIYIGDSSAKICLKDRMPDADAWSTCEVVEDVPCMLTRTERIYQLLEEQNAE